MAFDDDDREEERSIADRLSAAERDAIQNLWGMGYTVVPRERPADLYEVARAPAGMGYQWNSSPEVEGWAPVPYSRHPGIYAPLGTEGAIEHGDLYLVERPLSEVHAERQASHDKAHKNVDDWYARNAAAGITGSVTVLSESSKGPQNARSEER